MRLQVKQKEFPFFEINGTITFHSGQIKVYIETGSALVKWYKEGEYVGEMTILGGYWGAFPHGGEVNDWVIEFWKEGEMVYRHFHSVNSANVLLLPKRNGLNNLEFKTKIIGEANKIIEKGGYVWVYFEGSHEFDFSKNKITPLGFRLTPEMNFILEID
jgi:hypothetical protein